MRIIRREPNSGGAYPPMQVWRETAAPEGYALLPDTLSTDAFFEYNGFVTLTVVDDVVREMAPDRVRWEAWKASLPPATEPVMPPTPIE